MRNFESRCADIQAKIRTLSSEEASVEDISAFTDAVSALLDEVILEVEQPLIPERGGFRRKRRVNTVRTTAQLNSTRRNNEPPKEDPNSNSSFKNMRKLVLFLVAIKGILGSVKQVANNAPNIKGFPTPTDLLNDLSKSYEDYVVPMIETLEKNSDKFENASVVASLGIAILSTCREVNKHRDKMDTKEKIYAVCGTVLMFAGLGMIIAATINPTTVPVIAAIALVTLGVYMCQRSIERHKKDLKDNNIDQSLDNVHTNIKHVSKRFKISNAAVDVMRFSAATASRVKENIPPPPTWVTKASMMADKVSSSVKSFVRDFF